jgi:hypothetical protein
MLLQQTVSCRAADFAASQFTPGIQTRAKGNNEIELFLPRMRIWRGTGQSLKPFAEPFAAPWTFPQE